MNSAPRPPPYTHTLETNETESWYLAQRPQVSVCSGTPGLGTVLRDARMRCIYGRESL